MVKFIKDNSLIFSCLSNWGDLLLKTLHAYNLKQHSTTKYPPYQLYHAVEILEDISFIMKEIKTINQDNENQILNLPKMSKEQVEKMYLRANKYIECRTSQNYMASFDEAK